MLYSYKKLELALEGIAEECTGYQTKNGAVDVNVFPAGRTDRPLLLWPHPGGSVGRTRGVDAAPLCQIILSCRAEMLNSC